MDNNQIKRNYIFFVFGLSVVAVYLIYFFFNYFFRENPSIGHDYSYFLPELAAGHFWYLKNGLFKIPWYSPSFCGGVPFLGDPQSIYYSVPQFLTIFLSPLKAVFLTIFIFGFTGFTGIYLLLKRKLKCSSVFSVLGGFIFALNTMFLHRLMVGHLIFHAFMLCPLIAYFCLTKSDEIFSRKFFLNSIISGILIAYLYFSGMVQIIMPSLLGIIALCLIVQIFSNNSYKFISTFSIASLIALSLSAFNLNATLSFLENFPRDGYEFCGYASILSSFKNSFSLLFFGPGYYSEKLVNCFKLSQHEFQYSLTFIPLILLVFGGLGFVLTGKLKTSLKKTWAFLPLILILLTPIFLNTYDPSWSKFLKTIPILKSSSNLFRWICLYIPLISVLACKSVDILITSDTKKTVVALLSMLFIFSINIVQNTGFYDNALYNPNLIELGYNIAKERDFPTPISQVASKINLQLGVDTKRYGKNDLLVAGASHPKCYRAIFGYTTEIPGTPLQLGDPFLETKNKLNFKNPACFVFPKENNCSSGDLFKSNEKEELKRFLQYEAFNSKVSDYQKIANTISFLSFLFVAISLLFLSLLVWRDKKTGEV